MEFDEETHDKIIVMSRDIRYIREQLDNGKETFKNHKKAFMEYDTRMRILEQNQQLLTGKITIIIISIGAAILGTAHILIWILDKVMAK